MDLAAPPLIGPLWVATMRPPVARWLFYLQGIADRASTPAHEVDAHFALLHHDHGGSSFRKVVRGFELTEEKERFYTEGLREAGWPATILWADRDPALGEDRRRAFEDVLGVEAQVISAKHFLQEDRAQTVADTIVGARRVPVSPESVPVRLGARVAASPPAGPDEARRVPGTGSRPGRSPAGPPCWRKPREPRPAPGDVVARGHVHDREHVDPGVVCELGGIASSRVPGFRGPGRLLDREGAVVDEQLGGVRGDAGHLAGSRVSGDHDLASLARASPITWFGRTSEPFTEIVSPRCSRPKSGRR